MMRAIASELDIPRAPPSVPWQSQLVREDWDKAVAKTGPLEVGEAVIFSHGAGVVESLGEGGGITIKAASGNSFTFSSLGLLYDSIRHPSHSHI